MSAYRIACAAVVVGLCLALAAPILSYAQPFLEVTNPPADGLNAAHRLPITTYEWQTTAGSPDPAEVRHILLNVYDHGGQFTDAEAYIQSNPNAPEWSAWQPYSPPGTGTSWTTPPTTPGFYVFAVHGRDADGNASTGFSLDRNMRRVIVTEQEVGPVLMVTSGVMPAPIVSSILNLTPADIVVGSGIPVQFCWTVDATYYGLSGYYRWAWDLPDPSDDAGWETDWIPVAPGEEVCGSTRTFFFGTHSFSVMALDDGGFTSLVRIRITTSLPTPTEASTWGGIKALYGD
jgi:hypothetical protein